MSKLPPRKPKRKQKMLPALTKSQYILMAYESNPTLLTEEERRILLQATNKKDLLILDLALSFIRKIEDENRTTITDIFLLSYFRDKCIKSEKFEQAFVHANEILKAKLSLEETKAESQKEAEISADNEQKEAEISTDEDNKNEDEESSFGDLFLPKHFEFFDEAIKYSFEKLQTVQSKQHQESMDAHIAKQIENSYKDWKRTLRRFGG